MAIRLSYWQNKSILNEFSPATILIKQYPFKNYLIFDMAEYSR